MYLRRLNPPLPLLRAFTEVVRFGSVSRAAQSLNLTQSAVSKQLQELERWIGVSLFERSHKRLALTPSGERYNEAVKAVLSYLESATLELISSQTEGGTLNISIFPTFAAKWLIPRLPDFHRRHPQVILRYVPHTSAFDFQRSDLDCSIVYGDGNIPGVTCHYLDGREVVMIAPPASAGGKALRTLADVRRYTLLHHVAIPDAWLRWQNEFRVGELDTLVGPQFDQFETIIRAVSAGIGLALVPHCLVHEEIGAGVVREAFAGKAFGMVTSSSGYWFCHSDARSHMPQVEIFRAWLLEQV